MNRTALINSIKIMLLVVVSGIVLFLVCSEGGRLMILFNFLIKPVIWVYTLPVIGPFIFIISGLIVYTVIGAFLEDRKLVVHYGQDYIEYKKQAGFLLPRLR